MSILSKAFATKSYIRSASLSAVLLAAGIAPAYANLVVNGDFTQPGTGCEAGTNKLSGWTISAGNIDIESASCSGIKSADGETYFLDLTGSKGSSTVKDTATLSQTIETVVGQKYSLSFYFGGNPQWHTLHYANDSTLKAMTVSLNGSLKGVYGVDTSNASSTNAQWKKESITFTANTKTTIISFQSLNGSATVPSVFGPLLDDVVVVAE